MALAPGTRFGPYEVIEQIGSGGMGEVWRASDANLKREVALKTLPPAFVADADRLARFKREAEILASLNHPNIAIIHGLETMADQIIIVMELVEGPTLAEKIKQGPLPPDEALAIARQIADALEAAHALQLVHRDLKPANVKLRVDGTIKVLDFGIAKAIDARTISGSGSPALATPAVTETGVILGTAAYMSPEQARGKLVDERTDIWAFGCLLFEMLTGQPAFGGDDVMATLARVIDRDTDMSSMPGTITPAVRHTIRLCLEKDPRRRISDIRDVRLALEGRFETPLPQTAQSAVRQPLWRKALPVAAALIVAVVGTWFLTMISLTPTPQPREIRRSISSLPSGQAFNGAGFPVIAVSPDGGSIAYAAGGALQLRLLSDLNGREIPGTAGETPTVPVYSPDGEWILYGSTGGLKRVSINGGTPLPIVAESPSLGWRWDEDDMIRYVSGCQIQQVPASGGTPEIIADETDGDCVEPTLLPDGDHLLYERRGVSGREVVIHSLPTGDRTVLFPGAQPLYLAPGYLAYFDVNVGLMVRRFDLDTLEYGGPVAMANDIFTTGQVVHFRISPTGTLVYVRGDATSSGADALWVVDETGGAEQLDSPRRAFRNPSVSPEGDEVAVQVGNENDAQIFVYDLSGESELRQLTFEGRNQSPVWTPDGRWITYSSDRDGRFRIYRQPSDGSGVAEALTDPAEGTIHSYPAWTPDGEHLAFSEADEDGTDIWIVSVPDGTPELLVGGPGNQTAVAFSPNGEAMAYWSAVGGTNEVLAEPFPPDGSRTRISEAGIPSAFPVWSRDGTRLSYQTAGGTFAAVDLPASGFAIRNRRDLPFNGAPDERRLDSLPDGNRMIVTTSATLIGGNLAGREIVIVENWIEEVKQRLPMD